MKRVGIILLIICITMSVFGQKEKIQSSYIYNFTSYISWPDADKSGDFVIGVLGNGPIQNELNNLAATKKVVTQPIVIKNFSSAQEIEKCHILIITENKSTLLSEVLSKLNGSSTLIITEAPGLATKGSGINFVMKDGKMLFELNKGRIEKNGLKINSKLTALAVLVN